MTLKNDTDSAARPLAGVCVVEFSNKTEMSGRFLADLGAEVIFVEPPDGAPSRRKPPMVNGESLYFATHNANKLSVCIDLSREEGQGQLRQLLAQADIFIETTKPGTLDLMGLSKKALRKDFPKLVTLSITDFGQFGPYRDYEATEGVHMAMAGMLCRSGMPGKPPLMPPAVGYESAAMQAAWCAIVAYWEALQSGVGDYLDFSVYEGVAQILDPVLGVTGSAAAGRYPWDISTRDRPPLMPLYPIFPCADGHVRIIVLNPRQWESMYTWMGSPPQFADPAYAQINKRIAEIDAINAAYGKFFADKPGAELEVEGHRRNVPIARVASPSDVLKYPHFQARGTFIPFEVGGKTGVVTSGALDVDGKRAGIRTRAPHLGEHTAEVLRHSAAAAAKLQTVPTAATTPLPPLRKIRVLDFGIIVAGGECGRIFADQGAEVIKIEIRAFPDGTRQSFDPSQPVSAIFALGARNKKSVGINLKSEKGKDIFKQLVVKADIVLSNFKPGTLESLGVGYDVLKQINPGIIMGDSSALGSTGPMSRTLGYGPLVRSTVGLTYLWRYPEIEHSFSDGVTIYPDHLVAREVSIGVMAELIRRRRTHIGGTISMAQTDAFLTAMSHEFLRESLQPGSFIPHGNSAEFTAPDGVFPCAGDDEWCVVSVRDDADWTRLCGAIGRPQLAADPRFATVEARLKNRQLTDEVLTLWTKGHSPREVTRQLQIAGVPAGFMQRMDEYSSDPHLNARTFFRNMYQPGLKPLVAENGPCKAERMPDPDIRPAPAVFEHTREIISSWLNLPASEIEALIASGALEIAA